VPRIPDGRRPSGGAPVTDDLPVHLLTTARRHPPPLPADRDLPGAAELLAGAGAGCVARFLGGRGLETRRVEPAQAYYRPGRWLTVCFRASAVEQSSGRPVSLTVTVERHPDEQDAVWTFPDDPALPGLPLAADGHLVGRRLRPHQTDVAVEPLRYRPRRRAVLRYRLPGGRVLFGKVVTPARGRRLLALGHALRDTARRTGTSDLDLRLALPLGQVGRGALVLPFLPGSSLRDHLLGGGRLPDPDRVAALPGGLHRRCLPTFAPGTARASTATGGGARPVALGNLDGPRRRFDVRTTLTAAQVVGRLLPGEGCAAARLAEALIGWAEGSEPPEEWIVHGDLYENQVLVDGGTFGLIDLDDLGPGDPLLDAANFSAHLLILGTSGHPAAGGILRYREELRAAFCRRLDADPAALAWREAYCLLRLASGPFRVLHPEWPRRTADRLALAVAARSAR
jgi:hypothetical protein